jgi:hypothetical protein
MGGIIASPKDIAEKKKESEVGHQLEINDIGKGQYTISSGNTGCQDTFYNIPATDCKKGYGKNLGILEIEPCYIAPFMSPYASSYLAECQALYSKGDLRECIINAGENYLINPTYGTPKCSTTEDIIKQSQESNCHPYFIKCIGNFEIPYNKSREYAIRDMIVSNKKDDVEKYLVGWSNSSPLRKDIYNRQYKRVCNDGINYEGELVGKHDNTDNIYCKKWCSENTDKCPDAAMAICSNNFDNKSIFTSKYKEYCKDLKNDVTSVSEVNARNILMRKEYNEYKSLGNIAFTDLDIKKGFVKDSEHIKLPEDLAKDYDELWKAYCSGVTNESPREARMACSCFLSEEEIKEQGYASRPDCLNKTCALSIDAYRPYKTVRVYQPQCVQMPYGSEERNKCVEGTCPDICSQVIQAKGGNISIIKNIHLVQNCFDSTDKQVQDAITKELNESIGMSMMIYKIACIYTLLPNEFQTCIEEVEDNEGKFNTEKYENIRDRMNKYIKVYRLIMRTEVGVLKDLIDACKDKMNDVRIALNNLHSIKWADDLPKEKLEEYDDKKKVVIDALGPLASITNSIEKEVLGFDTKIKEYEESRLSIINEANLSISNFINRYPEYMKDDYVSYLNLYNKLIEIEKEGKTIRELEKILNDMYYIYNEYIENIKTEEKKMTEENILIRMEENENKISSTINTISSIISNIDNIGHEDNQKYKDEWRQLQDELKEREKGDLIALQLNDNYKNKIDGFIKMKEGKRITYEDLTVPEEEVPKEKKYGIVFVIITVLVVFLGIGALIFFLFIREKREEKIEISEKKDKDIS